MQRQSTYKTSPLERPPTSSVRGQLEPHDHRTAKGWRYIQTTNTPNQLKVLLPPGTASMYEQLLNFEELELRKKSSPSWERLQEIRHLKDRMIRKCQKLVKSSAARQSGGQFGLTFQTVVAPADFRLKEMEKWFLEQHKRTLAVLKQKKSVSGHSSSCKCMKCIDLAAAVEAGGALSSKIAETVRPSAASGRGTLPTVSSMQSEADPLYQQARHRSSIPTRIEKSKTFPSWYDSTTPVPLPTRVVTSHPPLPHLLRVRNLESGYDLSQDPQRIAVLPTSPPLAHPDSDISEAESHKHSAEPGPIVALGQRPSCIKRSSTGDLSKRVSWADNEDLDRQVNQYASAARGAYASGRKWEEIRDIYLEQMSGLELLHQQVGESLDHLRSESAQLKQADVTIQLQREMLHTTFQEFERKQSLFQAKVQEALEDADHVLLLTATKETLPPRYVS